MRSIFQYIESIATSPQPVLITGATGVGKELVARAVHTISRRQGDFIAVNVAGLDDNVFADTLFGHRKGAFTGADQTRTGLAEKASGGTLFLDEIGDLSPASPGKTPAFLAGRRILPPGIRRCQAFRCPDSRSHQPRTRDTAERGHVSEGPLLQASYSSCPYSTTS